MHVVIIHAHPEPRSFNGAMKDLAVQVLTEAGHTVQVSDLYAMNFKATADAADFLATANPDQLGYLREQRNASEQGSFAPDITAEHEKLFRADLIILQFPLWWRSLPAIMKGYIDRVFAIGTIYGRGAPGLKGRKAMLAFTTGGPVSECGRVCETEKLMNQLTHINDGILRYVGFEVLPPYIAWGPSGVNDARRQQYLAEYKEHLLTQVKLEVTTV